MTFEKNLNLNGQIALIVGANGKTGTAIAKRLASLGCYIIALVKRHPEKIKKILDNYGKHSVFVADITDVTMLYKIKNQLTKIDIIVNTVGESKNIPHKNVDELTDEYFDRMLTINLRSAFSIIRTFLPLMNQSENGLIINIGSASSLRTGGSNLAYAASKAGLDSLTRNLAVALAPKIRVNSINPSIMDTGFVPTDSSIVKKISDLTPLKRIATVDDVADVVESLACNMRFSTGQCFVIDGGRLL